MTGTSFGQASRSLKDHASKLKFPCAAPLPGHTPARIAMAWLQTRYSGPPSWGRLRDMICTGGVSGYPMVPWVRSAARARKIRAQEAGIMRAVTKTHTARNRKGCQDSMRTTGTGAPGPLCDGGRRDSGTHLGNAAACISTFRPMAAKPAKAEKDHGCAIGSASAD